MTEQTGQTSPPEWYTKPPAWLTDPPARRDPYPPDDRGRGGSSNDQELITAIRAMPEQVVSALREAIQGAQQQQRPPDPPQQQTGQQQQGTAAGSSTSGPPQQQGEETPREKLTFADRWFANQL